MTSSTKQKKADIDGVLMLALSAFIMVGSAGLSLVVATAYCLRRARKISMRVSSPCTILLFGYQLNNDQLTLTFRQRLDALAHQSVEHVERVLILGGLISGNYLTEAEVGRSYIYQKIPALEGRVLLENKSRNTLENLKHAKDTLIHSDLMLKVTLLSHSYHLPRCELMANTLGFDVKLVSADNSKLGWLSWDLWAEGFFIHWYMTGLWFGRFFGSKRILDKLT